MVTKEEFEKYVKVQESGKTNMFATDVVSMLSGLDRETIIKIMDNYGELNKKFGDEEWY